MVDKEILKYSIALQWLYRTRLRTEHQLLRQYGDAREAWKHIDELEMKEALERAEEELEFIDKHNISVYLYGTDEYPYRLNECPDAPTILYGKGNISINNQHFVSIVGTRRATDRGKEMTRQLVLDLAELVPDVTIVSGLAYGIDVAAHKAAIEAGLPTLIVLGHGLDRIYPHLHRPIAVQSLKNGGLLTEYVSQTEPFGPNFVARDRIIAGLADAVVVIESREKGGSLITARMASDYDREIFAVPGRPSDPNSLGCNNLIREQNAQLINSAEDIVEAMQWRLMERKPQQTQLVDLMFQLSDVERTLLDKLHEQEDGMHINSIVMETGLDYSNVSATLMMMELNELVKSLPGGIYRALK